MNFMSSLSIRTKRMIDIVGGVCLGVFLSPLLVLIAAAVKLQDGGSVLHRRRVVGIGGIHFDALKFRTMVRGAADIQDKLRSHNQVDGPQFKMAEDPRITRVGRFLRETYLDEIPQFFNILRGEMSVVGPRPSPKGENSLSRKKQNK